MKRILLRSITCAIFSVFLLLSLSGVASAHVSSKSNLHEYKHVLYKHAFIQPSEAQGCGWTQLRNFNLGVKDGNGNVIGIYGNVILWEFTCDGGLHTQTLEQVGGATILYARVTTNDGKQKDHSDTATYVNSDTVHGNIPGAEAYGCMNVEPSSSSPLYCDGEYNV